ncbi:hypothetical protein [Treponema sp. R6D11]
MKKNVVITSVVLLMIAVLIGSCASSGGGKTEEKAAPAVKFSCDFSDAAAGTAGWAMAPEEYWDFHGTAALSRDDKTLGSGMLRMDVDFSKDANSDWSEPKMRVNFDPPLENIRKFYFDFYYNPTFSKGGQFKSKIIIYSGKTALAENMADSIKAVEELPNGFVKATVALVARGAKPVDNMLLSIVGYRTNYKGPVFIGNIRWE